MQKRLAVVRLIVLLGALAAAAIAVVVVGLDRMGDWLRTAADSPWGPVAFAALYAVLVLLMLPGSLGTAAGGAMFGAWVGFGAALAGATVGACGAFAAARVFGRDGALVVIGDKAGAVDDFLERRGLLAITVLRLLPIVPFNALNYAAGLSGLRFGQYLLGTVVGMVPGTFIVANLASRASEPSSGAFVTSVATAIGALLASAYAASRLRPAFASEQNRSELG